MRGLSACSAIVAGVLRVITSFTPETSSRLFSLYLVIDLLLLIAVIGLYQFAVPVPRPAPVLGTALIFCALVVLIGRDLGVAPASVYAGAAATFSVGLDLFAIHLLRAPRRMPVWIPVIWLLSTIVGPLGFFIPQLHFLFAISGLAFGVALGGAGATMWWPPKPTQG